MRAFPAASATRLRSGATLTEVLISMLILAIGVVSIASLFPIGMLNSIRANKLTRATLLRNSAQAMLDVIPELVHDPDRNGNYTEHNNSIYVVDPLGRARIGNTFGPLIRYDGGFSNETAALQLVASPDSWDDNIGSDRAAPTSLQAAGVVVPGTIDLSTVAQGLNPAQLPSPAPPIPPVNYRVILIDPTGRESRVRTITSVNASTGKISWSVNQPVPTSSFGRLTEVRIERQNSRYTWMLSVRKPYVAEGIAPASVDVVVFFRRPLSAANEVELPATFGYGIDGEPGVQGVDDNGAGGDDDVGEMFWPGSDDRRSVRVSWTGVAPNIFRGGYIFDPINGQWYRVEQIINTGVNYADLQIDRDVIGRSTTVMIPSGVVSVFPLGTR